MTGAVVWYERVGIAREFSIEKQVCFVYLKLLQRGFYLGLKEWGIEDKQIIPLKMKCFTDDVFLS